MSRALASRISLPLVPHEAAKPADLTRIAQRFDLTSRAAATSYQLIRPTSHFAAARVDRLTAPAYSFIMVQGNDMLTELREIGGQLDRLLELCQRLAEENRSLRVSQEQLSAERANLMAKNEQARSRVEAMIARLRSLENNA
jgi:cell division protein ZapB